MKNNSIAYLIADLFKFFSTKRKFQIFFIFILSLFSAVAELATIGSLIPFIDIMIDPNKLFKYEILKNLFQFYEIVAISDIMFFMTALFIIIIIASIAIKVLLTYFSISVVHKISHELSIKIFKSMIFQPYSFHLKNNTSNTITNLSRSSAAIGILLLVTQSIVALILSLSIIMMLLYIDIELTLFGGTILGLFYILISIFSKKSLIKNSFKVAQNEELRIKNIQESFGGIRETILGNLYSIFVNKFKSIDWLMNKTLIKNNAIQVIPNHLVMMLAMLSLTVLIYIRSTSGAGLVSAIPILAGLILGAQKIIPQLQTMYNGWAKAQGNYKLVQELTNILNKTKGFSKKENKSFKPLKFKKDIILQSVSFKYENTGKYVFNNISLEIKKGKFIGIVGKTGCGKSTLVDIIMGLLEINRGKVKIDKINLNKNNIKNWQQNISHVPQSIYIADLSILENIVFGKDINLLDKKRLIECCKVAEIYQFINSKKHGFNTIVGERGGRLSGGQRQRIGIARALYLNSSLLVLDESTNALDENTEKKIFNNLRKYNQDVTIIAITHRKSLLKNFDYCYNLETNKLKNIN